MIRSGGIGGGVGAFADAGPPFSDTCRQLAALELAKQTHPQIGGLAHG